MTFDSIFNFIFDMYDLIWGSSMVLVDWFNSEVPAEIVALLDLPASATNLDLMLGAFVPMMLMLTLVGTITKALSPI